MAKTVFWSWQSDLDQRVTRHFVREALADAIAVLSADVEEADRPSLTSDTQGVAGTPDIVATILAKIDEAAVFVGDVTPIALSASGKALANPNVLLEMGYANKALTPHRVIQVWNTAFEGAVIDKLPFDMRGRRGPMAFHLPIGAGPAARRDARSALSGKLVDALKLAFEQLPGAPPEAVRWQAPVSAASDLWFDDGTIHVVTHPGHGTTKVRLRPAPHGFARLIPAQWTADKDARRALTSDTGHAAPLGDARDLGLGVSRGGAMIYRAEKVESGIMPVGSFTQWFAATGEFWGVANEFLFENRDGRRTVATGYIFNQWLHFLKRNAALALALGGAFPIHIRLGVTGLDDSWWPADGFGLREGWAAVEERFEYDDTLTDISDETLVAAAAAAFNGLAATYGIAAHTIEQIVALSRR